MRFLKALCVVTMLSVAGASHAQSPGARQGEEQTIPPGGLSRGDEVNQEALESGAARTRDAEIARVIANADRIFPFYYAPLIDALYRTGRRDEARQWNANAILRMSIDIDFMAAAGDGADGMSDFLSFYRMALQRNPPLTAFLDSDLRAQKAAIEGAIAWEEATPRRYILTDRFTIDETRARADGFIAALPERARETFAEAQARQIAGAREAAARRGASADLLDDADIAVRERRPAREAIEAVPQNLRTLLVARRSVKLACPGEIRFTAGAPITEGATQAAILCGELDNDTLQIVDLVNGRTLRRAASAGLDIENVFAFNAGGAVTLVARRDYAKDGDPRGMRPSSKAPLYALTARARLKPLRLYVPPELSAQHEASAYGFITSESGRYVSFAFMREIGNEPDPTNKIAVAYDLTRSALLMNRIRPYRPPANGNPQSEEVVGAFIDETGAEGSGPLLVSIVREVRQNFLAPTVIERVNLATGATARLELPNGVENGEPLPYGPGRALMYMGLAYQAEEATREYLVIDLQDASGGMRIAWRGRWEDRPAEVIPRAACTLVPYDEGEFWTFRTPAMQQRIKLTPLRGRPWSSCAVSVDGRHVALVVPPYAHVYELTQH